MNKNILQTPVEKGNILLLEPEAGLYFEMNETAVLIYQCINEGLNQNEMVAEIVKQYDVTESVASSDLKLHLEQLLSQKIILKA
ncbi:MAG: PqqD family protein [Proteobacteria bacterium]|nr:PqqD family protein [Pseudomonadota bacterium]